jgi:hypothetical protein
MTVADHTPPHLADIAAPAYATHVGEWDDYDTGRWSRPLTGTRHRRDVKVVGVPHDDGTVGRLVTVRCDDELTPAAARKLAAAITAAADEIDRLAQPRRELRPCGMPRSALIDGAQLRTTTTGHRDHAVADLVPMVGSAAIAGSAPTGTISAAT